METEICSKVPRINVMSPTSHAHGMADNFDSNLHFFPNSSNDFRSVIAICVAV